MSVLDDAAVVRREAQYRLARHDFSRYWRACAIKTATGLRRPEPWAYWDDARFSPRGLSLTEALGQRRNIIALKPRQIGFTTKVCGWTGFIGQFHTVLDIQVFSRGQLEAREFLRRIGTTLERLPEGLGTPLVQPTNRDELSFDGAGHIMAFPATEETGRSFTSEVVINDENAFHKYAAENYAAVESQARQMVTFSTANGDNFFKERWLKAWERPRGLDVPFFFPWWVRPHRPPAEEPEDGAEPGAVAPLVPIHLPCGCLGAGCARCDVPGYGRLGHQINQAWHEAKRAQYIYQEDFLAAYPATIEEAFAQKAGLVYPMFSEVRHVRPAPFGWRDAKVRMAAVDPGGGSMPTAILAIGQGGGGRLHVFAEFYQRESASVQAMGAWLVTRHAEASLHRVVVDPSQDSVRQSLYETGLPCGPREGKADNVRDDGILLVASLLASGVLTIDPSCVSLIHEFHSYRQRQARDPNTKDTYPTKTPVDHHGDALDCLRYLAMALQEWAGRYHGPVIIDIGRRRALQAV